MIREHKTAIIFLAKYIVLYLVLNSLYAYFVEHYLPNADPVTVLVTNTTDLFLSAFDPSVHSEVVIGSQNVPLLQNNQIVLEVYEGCNGINVMIVYAVFLVSFRGPLRSTISYLVLGLFVIFAMNILRIVGLYFIALYIPDSLYFVHKFLFTGIIYLVVFVLWYFWISAVKKWKPQEVAQKG